jgi:hypothetical protein
MKGTIMAKAPAPAPSPAPNKPVATFRIGLVKASVWKNENGGKTQYNTTFVRSYKDGDTWHDGDSFGHGDLLNLAKVAERAENWIANQD